MAMDEIIRRRFRMSKDDMVRGDRLVELCRGTPTVLENYSNSELTGTHRHDEKSHTISNRVSKAYILSILKLLPNRLLVMFEASNP